VGAGCGGEWCEVMSMSTDGWVTIDQNGSRVDSALHQVLEDASHSHSLLCSEEVAVTQEIRCYYS